MALYKKLLKGSVFQNLFLSVPFILQVFEETVYNKYLCQHTFTLGALIFVKLNLNLYKCFKDLSQVLRGY